jgi:hypothetical protein
MGRRSARGLARRRVISVPNTPSVPVEQKIHRVSITWIYRVMLFIVKIVRHINKLRGQNAEFLDCKDDGRYRQLPLWFKEFN